MPKDSTVEDLEQLANASRSIRRKFEPQWFLNMSYYVGRQWVAYDGNRLYEPQLEEWRSKPVDNRIRGMLRKEIAKSTKTRPTWVGTPKDSSDTEILRARMRERVFEAYWPRLNMTRKLRAALLWSRVTGAGFGRMWWDSTVGDAITVLTYADGHPQAGQVAKDQHGAPMKAELLGQLPGDMANMLKPRTLYRGDACFDLASPFELLPDPLAGEEGLVSAEWIIHDAIYSPDYVQDHFNIELEADATAVAGALETRFGLQNWGGKGEAAGYRGVRVRQYYSKPSSAAPGGKHVVYAPGNGGKIVLEEDNRDKCLPYIMFRGIPVPGRFWPEGTVTDMISPQTRMNKREAQIDENADRIGNPPLMRSSANADEVEWLGLPGEEIVFEDLGTPGSVPQFLQVPELPAYVQNDIDRMEHSLQEISAQHEVSSAQVPAGVTAASAINLLQEADDTLLGPDIEDMEVALQEGGRMLLKLLRSYCNDERLLKLAGDDGAWDVIAFKGESLGDPDDDEVQAGSGLPESKAAKQAAITDVLGYFVQNGIPIAQRDLRKVLRDFQVSGLEHFFASQGRDEEQVNDENRRLLLGQEFGINTYDDDEAHIAGHEDFQKSSRYSQLASDTPGRDLQAKFEKHVQAHRDRYAAQQAPPPGAPPGPPPPPGAPAPPAAPPAAANGIGPSAPLPSAS